MWTDAFILKTKDVVKAYKGFSIMKDGSKSDKVLFCLLIAFYIIVSGLLLYSNLFVKNYVLPVLSLILWIISVIISYSFQQHIYRRETKLYSKHSTTKTNFLYQFEQQLNNFGIERKDYTLYENYFAMELNFKNTFRNNEIAVYLSTIVCPILITTIPDEKKIESAIMVCLGIVIIPVFIFLINCFVNRKQYIYAGIIYYLKLGLLSEQFKKSQTAKESE